MSVKNFSGMKQVDKDRPEDLVEALEAAVATSVCRDFAQNWLRMQEAAARVVTTTT